MKGFASLFENGEENLYKIKSLGDKGLVSGVKESGSFGAPVLCEKGKYLLEKYNANQETRIRGPSDVEKFALREFFTWQEGLQQDYRHLPYRG